MTHVGDATAIDNQPSRRISPLDLEAPVNRRAASVSIALFAVIALGALLRMFGATVLTPHVDEGASLLAAHAVAETGTPILPSGTVYTQGALLSYLAAPFVRLGLDQLTDLQWLRMIVVAFGTVAIYFAYRFGAKVTGSERIALIMAALVAFDPLAIQWSGHFRMYGLLQAITFGLALAWTILLTHGVTLKRALTVIGIFWLAVSLHLGSAALLGLAMTLAALLVYRAAFFRNIPLLATLAGSALGGAALVLYNSTAGSSSVGDPAARSDSKPVSFVGDNLLRPFSISLDEFHIAALTKPDNLYWLIPGLLVAIAALAAARPMLRKPERMVHVGTLVALCFYWVPLVGTAIFVSSPKERYVLNAHLVGTVFLAVAIDAALARTPRQRPDFDVVPRWLTVGLSMLTVATLTLSPLWRLTHPVVHPDHNAAMEYVVDHYTPGQPVIVALPAIAWLAMPPEHRNDLYFLAGEQDQSRARRYTRYTEDGSLIDYWAGVPALTNPDRIRQFLQDHPDAWVVVDEDRLTEDWAYQGVVQNILMEETVPVATTAGGGLILRPSAHDAAWNRSQWRLIQAGQP